MIGPILLGELFEVLLGLPDVRHPDPVRSLRHPVEQAAWSARAVGLEPHSVDDVVVLLERHVFVLDLHLHSDLAPGLELHAKQVLRIFGEDLILHLGASAGGLVDELGDDGGVGLVGEHEDDRTRGFDRLTGLLDEVVGTPRSRAFPTSAPIPAPTATAGMSGAAKIPTSRPSPPPLTAPLPAVASAVWWIFTFPLSLL